MIASWVVFPALLAAISLGCGLLLEWAIGTRIPGVLLIPVGLASMIVVAQFAVSLSATAPLATPALIVAAIAGFALGRPWAERRAEAWVVACAIAVFLAYGAPVILSGQATFAGFIRLDDTATWMAITDRVMDHGRSLSGLPPSSYEATLDFNLAAGYPVGVFLPLGVARAVSRQDVAWVIQPYIAFLAMSMALAFSELIKPVMRAGWLRFAVVVLAAQPALLYGYSLWGGIKELAAAALIATVAALVPGSVLTGGDPRDPRQLVPLAVVTAAALAVLSVGGAAWLVPILIGALVLLLQRARGIALDFGIWFLAISLALSIPLFTTGHILPPTSSPLDSATAIGNLFEPLNKLQVFGIWPVGDFRARPGDMAPTYILIALVVGAGALGLLYAWRARAFGLLLYALGAIVGCIVIVSVASPWVSAKALATASPAVLFLALTGAACLIAAGRRIEGGVFLTALAVGVLISNVLAYRQANLAPRGQLTELERIGDRISGQAPTLMTEYEPYGVRHFLRRGDPEGVSELRRRLIPLRSGESVSKGLWADTDALSIPDLLTYRSLVLRRSPARSRPPALYSEIWSGRYYELWQKTDSRQLIDHLPLGNVTDPGAVPKCAKVLAFAQQARPDDLIVAAPRPANAILAMSAATAPGSWRRAQRGANSLFPDSAGTVTGTIDVPQEGRYELWLGGSARGQTDLSVDGHAVGSARDQLNNEGQYVDLGGARLGPGRHTVRLDYHGADLHPGSDAKGPDVEAIGPITAAMAPSPSDLIELSPARAAELCGRRLDWVEILR